MELDEVIVTPSEPESSAARENVPVVPTPTGEEVNDDDHEASDEVTAEIRDKVQLSHQVLLSSHLFLSRETLSLERTHSWQQRSCLRI